MYNESYKSYTEVCYMPIKTSQIDSLEDTKFEFKQDSSYAYSKPVDVNHPRHYINNKEFYEELCVYHESKVQALAKGEPIPPLTEKIGAAIIQIATRRCNSWKFAGYSDSWKQEMISNAIITATIRGHNFDPAKTNNPFAYFTQICNNAILEQIKLEKRQLYVKYKSMDMSNGFVADFDENDDTFDDESMESLESNGLSTQSSAFDVAYGERLRYIEDYEERNLKKKEDVKTKKTSDVNTLEFDE